MPAHPIVEVIKELAAQGLTPSEVAASIGTTVHSVIGYARRWGIKFAKKH